MRNKLLMLSALFFSLILFGQKDKWKTFEKDGYSIQYPKSWTYSDQKPQPMVQFVLLSEEDSQEEDNFRENINLSTESLQGRKMSLDAYVELALDQVTEQIPSAKILATEDVSLNGKKAKSFIWTADFGNGVMLKFKQYILISDGTAYILTFTSTEAEFDEYVNKATDILDTFKINS